MIVEDVEAFKLVESHPWVDVGVRLAAEHLNVVAEIDKGLRKMAYVDTLTAAMRLAAVRK